MDCYKLYSFKKDMLLMEVANSSYNTIYAKNACPLSNMGHVCGRGDDKFWCEKKIRREIFFELRYILLHCSS